MGDGNHDYLNNAAGASGNTNLTHSVLWFYIQEEGRGHRHCLLTSNATAIILPLQKLVNLTERIQLPQLSPGVSQLPGQLVRVPGNGLGGH